MVKVNGLTWPGPYCYKVIAGRIKIGRRYFQAGDLIYLNEALARSLYPGGQLKYHRTVSMDNKSPRNLMPGETIDKLSRKERKRLPIKELRNYAFLRFGIPKDSRTKRQLIRSMPPWRTVRLPT